MKNVHTVLIKWIQNQRTRELFKLWTQRKGEHSNIKSEYVQNSDVCVFCINNEMQLIQCSLLLSALYMFRAIIKNIV